MGLATSVMEAGELAAAALTFSHNGIVVASSVRESGTGCHCVYMLVVCAERLKCLHGSSLRCAGSIGRRAEGEVGAGARGSEQEAILLCSFVLRLSLVCPFLLPTEKAVLSEQTTPPPPFQPPLLPSHSSPSLTCVLSLLPIELRHGTSPPTRSTQTHTDSQFTPLWPLADRRLASSLVRLTLSSTLLWQLELSEFQVTFLSM